MSNTPTDPKHAQRASRFLVIVLAGIFVFGMAGFVLAVLDSEDDAAAGPARPSLPALESAPSADVEAQLAWPRMVLALAEAEAPLALEGEPSPLPPTPSTGPTSVQDPGASPQPVSLVDVRTPIVPVAGFWSKRAGLQRSDVRAALETGTAKGFGRVIVEESIADLLAAELGIELHPDVRRADSGKVADAVAKGALGLLAATDLGPSTRSLMINGVALLGNDRTMDIGAWPLTITQTLPEGEGWDQARTWVLVAGGDSFTDRGVYDTVVRKGKGVDYPFDGGTAKVTGHGCCDPVYNDNIVPRYVLTGNKGAVRKLFKGAELAIANHEQPVTDAAAFHGSGTRFSGKPELTRIFTRAGIDFLSLANNHIKDYGADGIRDTRRILRKNGIAFGGAGKDLSQARKIAYLETGDSTLAVIPCLGIVKIYWAAPGQSGATPCLDRYLVPDIKAAKRNADVVIVFPHWGVEYTRQPLGSMRQHAKRWTKAGADLVLGGHSHVAGAIEEFDGAPVLYSLGNLIFDQHWSTNTMESMLLEATFHGGQLAELRLRPYIIHDTSQPNFLDPRTGEGRRLLRSVKQASSDWLDW